MGSLVIPFPTIASDTRSMRLAKVTASSYDFTSDSFSFTLRLISRTPCMKAKNELDSFMSGFENALIANSVSLNEKSSMLSSFFCLILLSCIWSATISPDG